MKKIIVLILAFNLLNCSQKKSETNIKSDELQITLSEELKQIQSSGNLNGFSVSIVNEDSLLYSKGFGLADVSANKPYTANTIQNIASISKTLIGIALLKAQEQGLLLLDDPVTKHLGFEVINPYFPEETITIRHLTTHTSSIIDGDIYDEKSYVLKAPKDSQSKSNIEIPEEFNPPSENTSMKSFLYDVLNKSGNYYSADNYINKAPGTYFEYTNIGATLAALVVESASGEDYRDFTKKHILKPLKMNTSGWTFEDVNMDNHSKLYSNKETEFPFYTLITYPDGGLITSANDLSKFLIELIKGFSGEGTILNKDSFKEYFKPHLNDSHFEERDAENPYNDEYNFGVFIGQSAQDNIGHTGGDPGVTTFMFFNTKTKIGRLMIINTDLNSDADVQRLFSIWDKLGDYQEKLTEN
ncbi:serine hydrolase domain-containing protein [Winogradskyella sp. A2]|uniref:serine hydrolase domain-containing protein n=1 Tax=Winogradskyella sp. A2 TaxID=3366944 RepID=UPI00398C7FAD